MTGIPRTPWVSYRIPEGPHMSSPKKDFRDLLMYMCTLYIYIYAYNEYIYIYIYIYTYVWSTREVLCVRPKIQPSIPARPPKGVPSGLPGRRCGSPQSRSGCLRRPLAPEAESRGGLGCRPHASHFGFLGSEPPTIGFVLCLIPSVDGRIPAPL